MTGKKEIFFHVGLGKTASTYLQDKFFPNLKNIAYIQRTNYKHFRKTIENTKSDKIFISNEFDRQLEREVDRFSKYYPQAKTIIVLRSHGSWIASQYRRFVKNGKADKFEDFLDLENDQGDWKQKDLYFFPKIKYLEDKFDYKPLVLFYRDFKDDNFAYFDKFAHYMDVYYNKDEIDTTPKHKSYNEKQLKVIRKFRKKIFKKETNYSDIYTIRKIQRWLRMIPRYLILYSALLIPETWIGSEPLIPREQLQEVDEFYKDDWEKCLEYAQANNPV